MSTVQRAAIHSPSEICELNNNNLCISTWYRFKERERFTNTELSYVVALVSKSGNDDAMRRTQPTTSNNRCTSSIKGSSLQAVVPSFALESCMFSMPVILLFFIIKLLNKRKPFAISMIPGLNRTLDYYYSVLQEHVLPSSTLFSTHSAPQTKNCYNNHASVPPWPEQHERVRSISGQQRENHTRSILTRKVLRQQIKLMLQRDRVILHIQSSIFVHCIAQCLLLVTFKRV